jgi:hypothetical protein
LYTLRMDIHAPDRAILSLKEFFVHIGVVTCGILIALGLEGVRETIHNHRLVGETRESMRQEMGGNLENCKKELDQVTVDSNALKSLVGDFPTLAKEHPEQINVRLKAIFNPGYFFLANSWQTALSTGALEHMTTEEVSVYGGSAEAIRIYSGLQKDAESQETAAKSYFEAHPHLTPDQLEQGTEHLLLFYHAERSLAFVAPQMQEGIEKALRAASSN